MFRQLADIGFTAFISLYCCTRQMIENIHRQETLKASSKAKKITDPYTSEKHAERVNQLSHLMFERINHVQDEYTLHLHLLNKIKQQKKSKLPIAHLLFNHEPAATSRQDPWTTSLPDPYARQLINKSQYIRCQSEKSKGH